MFRNIALLGLVLIVTSAQVQAEILTEEEQNQLTIARVEVKQVGGKTMMEETNLHSKMVDLNQVDPGRVVSIARDVVALGEDIYRLVIKGKPTNTTSYAPLSIVPKVNGVAADPFDLENFRVPVKYTYEMNYYNLYNMNVVKFRYSVIYSYGGTFNGTGAYITGAQIVPESVKTLFGFDFSATMKLGGIQNNGTKANPIAGATLLLEHNVSSVMNAVTKVDTFFITGRGGFKAYK